MQAHEAASGALGSRLQVLTAFRVAQQAWDGQLEQLGATPADSPDCKQRLAQLEAAGQALLDACRAVEVCGPALA